jgi:N6-L-threonylcarbamoyladenine synthase
MKILGIETSCDETSIAVVEDGVRVLANAIFSQAEIHAKTGGVVPEVAAREHILKIIPVLDKALKEAKCGWDDIDAVAVTKGPGLVSSLIIGTEVASVISHLKGKPVIPVHHIVGHIYGNFLDRGDDEIKFPALVLTVSGGHNELILMKGHMDFVVLGETRDDAAGEAFDKVARILELGYPGGPVVSRAAESGSRTAFDFPRSYLEEGSLDFSFSGLKTAVLSEVKKQTQLHETLSLQLKSDLAASFEEAVADVLSDKIIQALDPSIKEIHLAGGVSANGRLREMTLKKAEGFGVKVRWPQKISYCTDNAAMIASAGYFLRDRAIIAPANIIPTISFGLF